MQRPEFDSGYTEEAARQLQICNACRYCEGYCAVFPAMTRRLEFGKAEADYLAHLCHNCGACLHACQYAPPHEFEVNLPRVMAQLRLRGYAEHTWPPALARLYADNGLALALALCAALGAFLLLALGLNGTLWHPPMAGEFYRVFPHNLLVGLFAPVFLYALLALGMSVRRYWHRLPRESEAGPGAGAAAAEATVDVLTLKYLDGGHGSGCNEADDAFSLWRRRWHHCTFYGFALCFASTCVATLYHYLLGLQAPYALNSLPVLLGVLGGIGLVVGPIGLLALNLRRHPLHGDARQQPMDRGFAALLLLTSITGLALLAWRDTSAMGALLALHLAAVMALFLTLPYGKFVHGFYRAAALLHYAIEKRQPSRLQLGSE